MKAADAKAPKFDSKWWKANKAKAADADGGVEKALKQYEDKKREFLTEARNSSAKTTDAFQKSLQDLKVQALKKGGDPKLGVMQKETKEALANYAKLCDVAIGDFKRVVGSPIITSPLATLVKSVPQFQTYCTKNHQAESYNFLSLMAKNPKKERRWYDDFIKAGAKFEVNIPGAVRAPFDKIAAAIKADPVANPDTPDTWGKAPWDQVVNEIAKMVKTDVLPRFRNYTTGELLAAKLP
jgi:vacuolar-type H+-ATPase subunit H